MRHSLHMGLLCAPVGVGFGAFVATGATGAGWGLFPLYAGAGALAAGSASWWLLVVRRRAYTHVSGALAGALAGIFGHYATWYCGLCWAILCYALVGGCTDAFGEPPPDLLQAIPVAGYASLFSLLLLGWMTAAIGALIGGLLAPRQRPAPAPAAEVVR